MSKSELVPGVYSRGKRKGRVENVRNTQRQKEEIHTQTLLPRPLFIPIGRMDQYEVRETRDV